MRVSLVCCVFNGDRFIREAVLSLLRQSFRDFELLIVDDGSTDTTSQILRELAAQDDRIRVLTNSTNLGLTKSLNRALTQATGNYVARMDADDIALPERLANQIAFLDTHPDIDMVGTAFEWIDAEGRIIGRPQVITDSQTLHKTLIRTNPFLHGSIMIRKKTLDRAGGYDETFKKAQDYDLWLRLSSTAHFANLPDILMQKRMTTHMISFKNEQEQIRFALRARWRALKRGDYPLWCAIHLIKPFLAIILPICIVRWARVHVFGQIVYKHPSMQ
ncbi:glycosyltransferase [Candidatus Uhrbacteria bacterium]|nr:glycosyltransferase [Candidatus Uhrbacteria bacterium]